MKNLGFHSCTMGWLASFLQDHQVCLRFNNTLSEEQGQPVGVPQGSPILPVLSIVYTSPLLHLMRAWFQSSMRMYVDNSLFFACGDTWDKVCHLLHTGYRQCVEWLQSIGLSIELDKTELMFFQKPQEQHPVPCPSSLTLWDPESASKYTVRPVETLHYLGFFLHWCLNWELHI
jgi:hypothetical protein